MSTTEKSTSSSPAAIVGAAALCAIAIAGIITAVVLAFGAHKHEALAPVVPPPSHAVTPPPSGTATKPTPTPTPTPAQPSVAVESLQRQLAQLNYYEGPIDGLMGPQTTQAIQYLQRDAHLPQTGQLNSVTQAALAQFLQHGNNQMDN